MTPWDENGLWLFTPAELESLPDGTVVESIMNDFSTKGVDHLDNDTRFGHTAYGIRNPFEHELKDMFIEWRLRGGY